MNALEALRQKIDHVTNEFAAGKLNRAQFDAIYRRYDDQRQVLERLIERNPDSQAWKQVMQPGLTAHLREQFEARCQYYAVFTLASTSHPLLVDGPQQPDIQKIIPAIHALLDRKNRPRTGLARKHLGGDRWLVLALGENSFTCVLYQLEPSRAQINRVRDLHNDFERANRSTLTSTSEKMVFPQRALVEQA